MTLRNVFFISAAAMAVLVLSGCAAQEETVGQKETMAQEETVAQAASDDTSDNVICRRIRPTGSRLAQRVCKTASDWERESEEDRDVLREQQMDSSVTSGSN